MVAKTVRLAGGLSRLGLWPMLAVPLAGAVALFLLWRLVPTPSDLVRASPGVVATTESAPGIVLTWQDLDMALARYGVRPEWPDTEVSVLLATPQYYAVTGRGALYKPTSGPSLVFFLAEDSHEELPSPLEPVLRLDDSTLQKPAVVEVLADSPHHRLSVIRYAVQTPESKPDLEEHSGHSGYAASTSEDRPAVTGQTRLIELLLGPADGTVPPDGVVSWELPIVYNKEYASSQVVVGDKAPQSLAPLAGSSVGWTWTAILALLAGMLVALSPCLVQLGAYFTATLAGVSAESSSPGARANAQRHIVYSALFFVLGFTVVYTAGGAAAGYVGQSLQSLGLFTRWARPLSIVAGVVILLLAVRVAWNARVPLVCRLPLTHVFGERKRTGMLGSTVMGFTFAGGCLTCFSASVLPALLLFAGSTGSMASGAALLLVFSLGISLPCLALAFGASRFQPLLQRYYRLAPALGLAGALVMALFGVIMVSNQFHVVSGLIYRLMGIS